MPAEPEPVANDREPLWTRSFVLAIAVSFLVSLVFITLVTTTALYAVDRFQASEAMAGFAAGAFVLGAVFSRIFFGKFLDVVGRRRTILIALAVFLSRHFCITPLTVSCCSFSFASSMGRPSVSRTQPSPLQ